MSQTARSPAPTVSVIVPAYNAAPYLSEALESLRVQTLADIEVLVVDDGSTDDTECIARSYAGRDGRFRVFCCPEASGRPACARNVGLRAARGTYVALLDADDIAVATRLETSLRALRETGASVAFGDFRKFHDDGTPFDQSHLDARSFRERAAEYLEPVDGKTFRCSARFAAYLLTDVPAMNTQTFFAVRADLTAVGLFDEALVGGEDFDLFLRLVDRYAVAYVADVQTLMRVHATSLTATRTDRCVADSIGVRHAHLDRLRSHMTRTEQRRATHTTAQMLADLGYGRWLRGARAEARSALAESWRLDHDGRVALMYLKAWFPREHLTRARSILMHNPA